ncbi:hypothetical protein [Nocardia rhamnosiphila]
MTDRVRLYPFAHGEETSDAAMARMEQERDRLSAHIDELIRTRDALDRLMAVNREHYASLRGA